MADFDKTDLDSDDLNSAGNSYFITTTYSVEAIIKAKNYYSLNSTNFKSFIIQISGENFQNSS